MQPKSKKCVIPKIFYLGEKIRGMKLTKPKLLETISQLNNGKSKYQARKIAHISKQRVYQVWNAYLKTRELPTIGKGIGRPQRPIQEWEINTVKAAYEKYRVSADTLERLIKRDYGLHIPHNLIHKILLQLSYATPKQKKDIRKVVRKHNVKRGWRTTHIRNTIYETAGIKYSTRQIIRISQSWGLSKIKPRPRYAFSKEEERVDFLKKTDAI